LCQHFTCLLIIIIMIIDDYLCLLMIVMIIVRLLVLQLCNRVDLTFIVMFVFLYLANHSTQLVLCLPEFTWPMVPKFLQGLFMDSESECWTF